MNIITVILVLIIIFIAFYAYIAFILRNKRKFPEKLQREIRDHMNTIQNMDINMQLLEYDKILDQCLIHKRYKGSLGSKMRKHNKNFLNTNAIWEAHKLRNRIAHEMHFTPNSAQASRAVNAFKKEILNFIDK